jgi:hypothetical protein
LPFTSLSEFRAFRSFIALLILLQAISMMVARRTTISSPVIEQSAPPAIHHCDKQIRWSWGCVSAIDSNGRTIWIADAHRDDGKRFIVHAGEKVTAFLELESAIRACGELV